MYTKRPNKFRRSVVTALLMCGVLTLQITWADTGALPSGREIAEKVNARDEGAFVSRTLTMTMTDRKGKSRVRETFGYRKYFGAEKRTIIFYQSPANIKDTAFLTYDYPQVDKDDAQWLYLPAARKVRRISASDRGDYFLGTDFTYEDIKKESKLSLEDYTFETVGEEELDGHRCFIIESTPVNDKTAKELGYGKIRSWVDPEIWMSRKSEFWDYRMNPLKTLTTMEIRQLDGISTAHRMEVDNHKTKHHTTFEFANVDYNTPVEDDVFTERALKRGAPR